jgi:hypothetical protein
MVKLKIKPDPVIVENYERIKQKMLRNFETQLAHDVLDDDYEDIRTLLEITLLKLGGSHDFEGIMDLLDAERDYYGSIQRTLLVAQKRLFGALIEQIKAALSVLAHSKFSTKDTSKVDPILSQIHETIEKTVLNSKEILKAPGISLRDSA